MKSAGILFEKPTKELPEVLLTKKFVHWSSFSRCLQKHPLVSSLCLKFRILCFQKSNLQNKKRLSIWKIYRVLVLTYLKLIKISYKTYQILSIFNYKICNFPIKNVLSLFELRTIFQAEKQWEILMKKLDDHFQ